MTGATRFVAATAALLTSTPFGAVAQDAPSAAPAAPAAAVQGTLRGDVTWTGTVRLTGDVTFEAGSRLLIREGTTVVVAAQDGLQTGFHPQRIEIHVHGVIQAEGSSTAPIRFVPEQEFDRTRHGAWHGIVLHRNEKEAQQRSRLANVELQGAFAAFQVPHGSPLVEDCVFLHCATGVEVGSAYRDERFYGVRGGSASPELLRCRFARCGTGVYAEGQAAPEIQRSVFHRCSWAIGSERKSYSNHLEGPGCSVRGCAILGCDTGIVGAALVRDTIFLRTRTALRLSDYHDRIATRVDQVVFENNLVEGAESDIVGDTGIARGMLRGDPAFAGPLEDLERPGAPLPECLRLGAGSAAIGRGENGGDLGPLPQPRAAAEGATWTAPGTRVTAALALRGDAPKDWQRLRRPVPGGAVGPAWWATIAGDKGGLLRLRRWLGPEAASGVLAFEMPAAAAGAAKLHFAGDLDEIEIALGGDVVFRQKKRTRLAAAREVPLPAVPENGVLLIRVRGWGPDPRLLLALEGTSPKPPDAAPLPLRLASSRALRTKDGTFVEIAVDAPLHWAAAPSHPIAQAIVVGQKDPPRALEATWLSSKKLRLGPLPQGFDKQEIEVTFPGLRSAMGGMLPAEPLRLRTP